MGKSKADKKVYSALPLAPWIYLNQYCDGSPGSANHVASALEALIPKAIVIRQASSSISYDGSDLRAHRETVCIIADQKSDASAAASLANLRQELAIKHGCNFASVNVYQNEKDEKVKWGPNHLELNGAGSTAAENAEKIYKWLYKAFTVPETLHLIPEKEMLAIDTKSFPGYDYCPIADSRKHCKDAKIQFVALITSKPEVGPDQKLHWTVTDRTGTANFYFQYRGPTSKYTWDWVLALQPGDRKALPRMPMFKITEKKRVRVAKAPFRGVAFVVGGTGTAIKGIGKGLCYISNKVKLGDSTQWVPEADVNRGRVMPVQPGCEKKTEIKIFNEKGEKLWKWDDEDGDASTTAGSIYNEKTGKEFC